MTVFLVIVIGIALLEIKAAKPGEFFGDCLSRERTAAVNGLFSLLIFLSHASSYLDTSGPEDSVYLAMRIYLDQLVVVTFLFYSGYGIMESIKAKGAPYVRSLPFHRFFKVFYHMAAAVCLYILVNLILGKTLEPVQTLLAFTGWTSIGNSNWYIFTVLALYLIVFVCFFLARYNRYLGVALTAAAAALFVLWQKWLDRGPWTYNTTLLFPAGMAFSLLRPKLEKLITKNDGFYFGSLGILTAAFLAASQYRQRRFLFYTVWALLFMALIVTVSRKLQLGNSILQWFGAHIFSFFILQRIPFMILSALGLSEHKYQFVILSFLFTLVLASLFDLAMGKLDGLLYGKRRPAKG